MIAVEPPVARGSGRAVSAVAYFAVPDPASKTMTYWRQTGEGLSPWPAKARYGPRLLKTDVPAGLTGTERAAWLSAWVDARAVPFSQAIRGAINADPQGCAARFAALTVRCVSCGRRLKDPSSKVAGVGPECIQDLSAGAVAALAEMVAVAHAEAVAATAAL